MTGPSDNKERLVTLREFVASGIQRAVLSKVDHLIYIM